jgi:hypothetical protein
VKRKRGTEKLTIVTDREREREKEREREREREKREREDSRGTLFG